MRKFYIQSWAAAILGFLTIHISTAQELPLVPDKSGSFEIVKRTDYVPAGFGFTKAEIVGNLAKISEVVELIKQNPVLAGMKGFNGRARIYNVLYDGKCSYGVSARISFEFSSFFRLKNGNTTFNAIEPPEWSLYINNASSLGSGFATNNISEGTCYLTSTFNKKTLAPGIDVYDDEVFVIYNATRPPYWIPVSVGEAFAAARREMEKEKDEISLKYLKEFFDKEYNMVPIADHNKPAYFGGGISRVSSKPGIIENENLFPPIMKVNPGYWDKNLPRSAIQFIYFSLPQNKKALTQTVQQYLKANSTSYHLALFQQQFNMDLVYQLAALVGK